MALLNIQKHSDGLLIKHFINPLDKTNHYPIIDLQILTYYGLLFLTLLFLWQFLFIVDLSVRGS